MHYVQTLLLRLVCALAALWLAGFYADAQQFLTPATNADHFGNLSQSVDFVWTYNTPDISKTSLYCQVNRQNIVFKRAAAGATADIQPPFIGRADAIDVTSNQPFRFGFKLKNLAFADANTTYTCFMTYDGNAPIQSNAYNFKIYEPPRVVNCLTDGLHVDSNGNRYFSVPEGGVLNSTCYVYGNPVPTLICSTYDKGNLLKSSLPSTPSRINYTSYPPEKRMLFYNVRRDVAKVICVADGQAAGRLSIEQSVRVDYAQQFLTPTTNSDHFGNLSQSVDFIWTYNTPDISKTSLYCQVNRQNIVFKRAAAGATADIQAPFIGRADAIDITSNQPFRFGFKLKNLAFTDANTYACFLTYEGGAPVWSNVYYFKIYEPPRVVNCLTDGLQVDNNGNRYFSVREGGVLNSTCYVYGNPVPTLICSTYDKGNLLKSSLPSTPSRINYTSYPPEKRMLFYNVRRAVAKVICIADGQAAGSLSIEQSVRVDYLPSSPRNIKLVRSTSHSIRISWEAPLEPGLSRITDYYMELVHPNGTIAVTNHTIILSVAPILNYTFIRLYANSEYSIRIAAYNAIGMGILSQTVTFSTVYIDAQKFLTPAASTDHFGNLSQSVDFVWTYRTLDISKTSLYCQVNWQTIVLKRAAARATADIQPPFIGKADAIDNTTSQPYSFGFKLRNLTLTDVNTYTCFMTYDGNAPIQSNVYNFKIYEPPRAVNCLTDGLLVDNNGNRYFSVREGGVLNSTCYVYGNPVPTLICRTYDIGNIPQFSLSSTPSRINYTSYPPDKRMLFYNVRRAVVKVICVADGQAAGRLSIEQSVRVDYFPSAPRNVKLIRSTPDSIRISWEAPLEPGLSRITDYHMELVHANGLITVTNHTVILSVNPILDYTFTRLYANSEYSIRVAAYNAIGMGARSPTSTFKTVSHESDLNGHNSISVIPERIALYTLVPILVVIIATLTIWIVRLKKTDTSRPYKESSDSQSHGRKSNYMDLELNRMNSESQTYATISNPNATESNNYYMEVKEKKEANIQWSNSSKEYE